MTSQPRDMTVNELFAVLRAEHGADRVLDVYMDENGSVSRVHVNPYRVRFSTVLQELRPYEYPLPR